MAGLSILGSSEIVNQGCSLIRNMVLARYLSKADFGVAALLGLFLQLLEITSKFSLGQQIIQARDGDTGEYLSRAHFVQICLGSISTLLILLLAYPFSHFFTAGNYLAAICLVSLVPFLNGLSHLNIYQKCRRLNFIPLTLVDTIPQVFTTSLVWFFAAYFKDYRAVLLIMISRSALSCAMSHFLASDRFRMSFDRVFLKTSFLFGLPLLFSGLIQFANFQGDSLVVGSTYSLEQLGEYSVALTIAMTPSLAIIRVTNSFILPYLSEARESSDLFHSRYAQIIELMALIACCSSIMMLFYGELLIRVLFGSKYVGIGLLACWLSIAQSVRLIRNVVGNAAMAKGDTVNSLISSAWRLCGLALAIVVGIFKWNIALFALASLLGEIAALIFVSIRIHRLQSITLRSTLAPTLFSGIAIGISILVYLFCSTHPRPIINMTVGLFMLVIAIASLTLCFHNIRTLFKKLINPVIQHFQLH